jgi:hypothetical protein
VEEFVDKFQQEYDRRIIQGRNNSYENWGAARDSFNAAFEVVGEMNPDGLVPVGTMARELCELSGGRWIGNHMDSMAAGLADQKQFDVYKEWSTLVDDILRHDCLVPVPLRTPAASHRVLRRPVPSKPS